MPRLPAATPCLPETDSAMTAPLAKSAFSGIATVAHLAAGGETPALASHQAALARALADKVGARLVVDASHALGVVEVAGELCDVVVSCSYKWMLGTHGVGVFFVNGRRWPDLQAPWTGWHSVDLQEDWRQRATARAKNSIERFEIG